MGSGKRRRLRTALLPLQGPIKPRWASLRLALQNVQGPGSRISQELVDASWKVVVLPGGSLEHTGAAGHCRGCLRIIEALAVALGMCISYVAAWQKLHAEAAAECAFVLSEMICWAQSCRAWGHWSGEMGNDNDESLNP